MAIIEPLTSGIIIAKITGNQPNEKNALSFLPLVIPISKRKIARNPLKRSFVNGFIPSACLALAMYPIIKLPRMSNTLPLVNECFITLLLLILLDSSLLNNEIKTKPIIIAGDSIKAMIATMCP